MLDSEPVFEARMKGVGLSEAQIQQLTTEGVSTLAKMAFLVGCQPGVGDDSEFVKAASELLGHDQSNPISKGTLASMRRLWFEAHTVALNEVKQKLDKTDEATCKRLPQPEREVRRQAQQSRMVGLILEGQLEPSNSLIDLVNTIKDDDVLRWVDPSVCTHRSSELQGQKRETFLKLDSQGQLKQVVKEEPQQAETNTEYRLRLCLQRRSLAFDQLDLLPYLDMEKVHNFLFDLLLKPVPSSHKQPSLEQIMLADRQIWVKMSEQLRSGLSKKPDGSYPMQAALQQALADPVIQSMLQPLAKSNASQGNFGKQDRKSPNHNRRSTPYSKGNSKGQSKGAGKGKGRGKGNFSGGLGGGMPKGLEGGSKQTREGKRICFGYNLGTCRTNNCEKGLHICCGCFAKEHSYQNCPSKA